MDWLSRLFNRCRVDRTVATLETAVTSVAVLVDQPERFRLHAATVASELGPAAITRLAQRFHSPPTPEPSGFGFRERGLGGWLAAWQFAIFELFFHFGAAAIPTLRAVAFGEYDWTQGNAVEVLVRLAALGIDRERTVRDLRLYFPRFRHEATLYVVRPLSHHAARDPDIASVVRELEDLPAWKDAADELRRRSPDDTDHRGRRPTTA